MTEEERRLFVQMQADLAEMKEETRAHREHTDANMAKLIKLHDAFLCTPTGAAKDAKPLLEKIVNLVTTVERTSWAGRMMVLTVVGMSTLLGAIAAIWAAIGSAK